MLDNACSVVRPGLLAACLAGALPHAACAATVPTVPLTLVNNTQSGQDLYISIVGESGGVWYSVVDAEGDVQPTQYSPTPSTFAVDIGTAAHVKLRLPQLIGMRVYVSLGKPLYVNTSSSGTPGAPAGWVASDPNYSTLFDWAELTWVPNADGTASSLGGNVTQVDMFGLAMKLTLAGVEGDFKTKVTDSSGFAASPGTTVRQQILTGLAAAMAPWNALVLDDANSKPFRAISPYHGIENGVFPNDELQGFIGQVFARYAGGGITAQTGNVAFTAQAIGGALVFTSMQTGATFQISEPDTYAAYTGNMPPVPAPSDPILDSQALAIGAQLQGALMRTSLLVNGNLTACDTAQFYHQAPVNEFARIIHKYALNHHAYAFGFDDTCTQSSYIGVFNPVAMTLTIGPL